MKAVVLLSGGVDSSTCLALAVKKYGAEDVFALCLYYGQRHKREMKAARDIAEHYQVRLAEMDLSKVFQWSDCSLLEHSNVQVPESEYVEQLKTTGGNPVSTYVPFRNGLMLSAATSIALSMGASVVFYGAHADDAAGNAYPDCSAAFTAAMNKAVFLGTGEKIRVAAPFVMDNKAGVIRTGLRLGVPYEKTWSCYNGKNRPCHKCGTCIDREKAFISNGVIDPLLI